MSHLRAPRNLDELLNYRLMRLHAMSGAPVVRLLEGRYGIARREWRLLALLATHGALAPSELAARGDLDRARTSRAIGTLATKQLLERHEQPGDRRRAVVRLTAAGRRLYDEIFPQVAEINRRVVAQLPDALLEQFDAALAQLTRDAALVNRQVSLDVRADRRHGGTRRKWHGDAELPAPPPRPSLSPATATAGEAASPLSPCPPPPTATPTEAAAPKPAAP
jgi:DNA-binding MarR family transcriptional regulator